MVEILRTSWAGEASQPTPRLDWTLPSALDEANGSEKPTAARSEPSDNSNGPITTQTFQDLETVFEQRRRVLLRECKKLDRIQFPRTNNFKIFSGNLSICLINKVRNIGILQSRLCNVCG